MTYSIISPQAERVVLDVLMGLIPNKKNNYLENLIP